MNHDSHLAREPLKMHAFSFRSLSSYIYPMHASPIQMKLQVGEATHYGQTCSGLDEGSKKMEYSIYFGSDKRIDLPIYGVKQIIAEWKFF